MWESLVSLLGTFRVSHWVLLLLLLVGAYPLRLSWLSLCILNKSSKKNGWRRLKLSSLLWDLGHIDIMHRREKLIREHGGRA